MIGHAIVFAALFTVSAGAVTLADSAASEDDHPPTPIAVMSLREVEPDRRVAAKQWQSPYCGIWDDGCTKCTRTSVQGPATCASLDDRATIGICKPRGILCSALAKSNAHDFTELERVCGTWGYVTLVPPGSHWPIPLALFVTGFEYDKTSRIWRGNSMGMATRGRSHDEQFARRVMAAIGRNQETEFTRGRRASITTYFCEATWAAWTPQGAAEPAWLDLIERK
jgi:hypothetical protein